MSDSLSREQLLDYIKKQKLKIKKLETKNAELLTEVDTVKSSNPSNPNSSENNGLTSDELDECHHKISELEEDLEAKNKKLREVQSTSKNRINVLENELSTLKAKAAEDMDALVEHLTTINTLKEAFNEKHSQWEQQCQLASDLQLQVGRAEEALLAIDAKTPTSDHSCSQCASHVETISKSEQTTIKYKNMVKTKMKEIDNQKQQNAALDNRIDEMLAEINTLQTDAKAYESLVDEQKKATANAETDLKDITAKYDSLLSEFETMKCQEQDGTSMLLKENQQLQGIVKYLCLWKYLNILRCKYIL